MDNSIKFIRTTKKKYLNLGVCDCNTLYFCIDTQESFLGDKVLTDGVRVIPSRNDLPDFHCAADGILYYCNDTKSGYMLSPTKDEWLQTM